jgi:uncharacterized protein YprB with RNaseH-like and TPR domain
MSASPAELADLRQKLAALGFTRPAGSLRRAAVRPRIVEDPSPPAPAGCITESTPHGPVLVRREFVLATPLDEPTALASCAGLPEGALESPLFLDTETTGLSGGTGTVAFLVGLAWPTRDGIELAQYFLADFHQEPALLWAIGECLRRHSAIVTYNGKTFDLPLLQNRLVMARSRPSWPSLPHLDLLGVVRRLFRPRLPDCALRTVEAAVLALQREEDLPGSLIPSRYFAWLRGSDAGLEAVFAHNRQDVLSLVDLLNRVNAVIECPDGLHALDRFSRARYLEARGQDAEALREYGELWRLYPRHPQRGTLGLRLARRLRQAGRWREAQAVLEECWRTHCYPYQAALELAKLLEHQARDFLAARRLVDDALAMLGVAVVDDGRLRTDLERRRGRLDRRLGTSQTTRERLDRQAPYELALTG